LRTFTKGHDHLRLSHRFGFWWVSGIVLGVAMLTLFGLFEKRGNDVLKMIDTMKSWP
jgi:hypothetical protein